MNRLALASSVLIGLLLSALPGSAQDRSWDTWGMHPMWGLWGIGMMLFMFAFWALVIVGLVLGIRWFLGQGREPRADRALTILRERYARGEIGKDEFDARRRDLEAV